MKSIRMVLWGGLALAGWAGQLCAQPNDGSTSASDLAVMMQALEQTAPVAAGSLPAGGMAGTFWSAQNPYFPPLPGDTLGLDVWPLGDGTYLLNDTNVDYDALAADAAARDRATARTRMNMLADSLASSYAYGNPVYLTNLNVTVGYCDVMAAGFSVAGGTNFVPYDILMTTNLTLPLSQWNWLGIGYTSNYYSFSGQPGSQAFYLLAKPSQTMTVGFGDDSSNQCDVPYGLTNALQVAGGYGQSLALKADGTVTAWGGGSYGIGEAPTNLTGVAMIAAGWNHNVALLTNGTVTAWGDDFFGETNIPAGLTNVTVISAQALHTLALLTNGTVVAWGYGPDGETNVPAGLTNVTAISAGYQFNLAVSNGFVVAWGDNAYGQCSPPAGLSNVVDVAAGLYHGLALLKNGTVAAWGDDAYGETDVPAGLSNVVAIAAGGDSDYDDGILSAFSLALKSDGTVVAWGDAAATAPVGGLTHVIGLAAGADHALAIRTGPPTPVIAVEPVDEYQVLGGSVTFTSRGTGLYGVTYQWQTNGVNLTDATNATLTLTNVQAAQTNIAYAVTVTDNGGQGMITSSNASFLPVTPPSIVSQSPMSTNLFVVYETNATLSVLATAPGMTNGFPLSYQWQYNGVNISGATASLYTFTATAIASGLYSVLVSNVSGTVAAGWEITVLGTNGLEIIHQPTVVYQIAGGIVAFVVGAVSTNPVAYQWQFEGTNISGAVSETLTLTNVQATQAGYYDVVVSDGVNSFVSSNAWFYLVTPPAINSQSQPTNPTVSFQSDVVLSVAASAPGQNNGFPLHYEWQFNGSDIPDPFNRDNTNVYEFTTGYGMSGTYSVIVTNAAGSTNTSWQVNVVAPGSCWVWGDNEYGESTVPAGGTNIMGLSAGDDDTVAVEDNGTVIQWGNNWGDVPGNLTNAVAVAAGYQVSLGLRSNGTVEAWGYNGNPAYDVPSGLAGVKAIGLGWYHGVALLTNGMVVCWGSGDDYDGSNLTNVPPGLTNVTAIAAGGVHSLALKSDGTVVAWGDGTGGVTNIPSGLSNVVAVAAGGYHNLALKSDGTITAWGDDSEGQIDVPLGLSNVMAVAAGDYHSVALKNDGTVISWGFGYYGQTNTPALTQVKLIAAGGDHTVAGIFSPTVMYPVDVTKDLLLIYNTNSADSATVLNYYLANRPMVGGANVLGIGCPGIYIANATNQGWVTLSNATDFETISPPDFTNQVLNPVLGWLATNPTKRPQYVIMMLDVPSRINTNGISTNAASFPFYYTSASGPSVSCQLATSTAAWRPFINHINMNGTNDCIGYINKLQYFGSNYSPGKLIISASAGGYENTNWYFDNTAYIGITENVSVLNASNGIVQSGASPASVTYTNARPDYGYSNHITSGFNVAGYLCFGSHSSLGVEFPLGEDMPWSGNSGWWLIETVESFNGRRYETDQSTIVTWFYGNSFGGTNYKNTPIGAVSYTDEPGEPGVNDDGIYFGLWAAGKNFAVCAWESRMTVNFQAVGDPFVER